jgi:anhydro-N-acetylmuramic acid kinase
MTELFVGLMSGTSLDGVDGVVVDFTAVGASGELRSMKVLAHAHRPFPSVLRDELFALNGNCENELHRAALAGNGLARLYASVVSTLLDQAQVLPSQIKAIGAHGQTVRHRPGVGDGIGYSLQINNPALLAELSGIHVVADFRSRDLAAGGQGAPLVPAFHQALFGRQQEAMAVLNLGGIANLTSLSPDGHTIGFDCGPANVLMDNWCMRHTGKAFDVDGVWAASGQVLPRLLALFRSEPYFALPPPKSTGRDLFNRTWLTAKMKEYGAQPLAQDVQATLCELTALTCADAVLRHAPATKDLLVCGGGALNKHLMQRLSQHLPKLQVSSTDSHGLPAMEVEATAFAWLAYAHVHRQYGNLSSVTGAAGPRILGAFYPAT